MSVAASASHFALVFNQFNASKPQDFLNSGVSYNDFDGPTVLESIEYLQFLSASYESLIASNELHLVSKTALNGLSSQVQSVNNSYLQLTNLRDQSSFQNFAIVLDTFVYHTRMFGIPMLAAGGAQLEVQRLAFANELQTLVNNNIEVDALKKDVRTLITPAIAGSLSDSFTLRRDNIFRGRIVWLVACTLLGGFASYATFDFVHAVTAAAGKSATAGAEPQLTLWTVITIRTAVLIPLFAAFGFAFAQYKKERDFEEEYAHKAAVVSARWLIDNQ